MNVPRTGDFICVCEPNVAAFVVSEIQVIAAKRRSYLIGNFDERRALDVVPDAVMSLR